ncbi:MAG: hypothetical protein ACOH5I_03545 [Oligoflexus sp.]
MKDILQLLAEKGELGESNLALIKQYIEKWQLSPYEAMLETHIISEDRLADQLAEIYQVQRVITIEEHELQVESFEKINYEEAKDLKCILLNVNSSPKPLLVVADPSQDGLQKFLAKLPFSYQLAIAESTVIEEAIDRFYPIEQQLPSLFRGIDPKSRSTDNE